MRFCASVRAPFPHNQQATAQVPYDPEADKKSIIVLNVHFATQPRELEKHFEVIGGITRVTIVKDKFTQQPKGMAYVQFDSEHSVSLSKALDQTNFFGRPITVMPKRGVIFRGPNPPAPTRSHLLPPAPTYSHLLSGKFQKSTKN